MADSMKGVPVYRCDLCGGVAFKVDHEVGPEVLAVFVTNGPSVIQASDVPRAIVHKCPNGGRGIANIVGIVPDEVVRASTTPIVEPPQDKGMN